MRTFKGANTIYIHHTFIFIQNKSKYCVWIGAWQITGVASHGRVHFSEIMCPGTYLEENTTIKDILGALKGTCLCIFSVCVGFGGSCLINLSDQKWLRKSSCVFGKESWLLQYYICVFMSAITPTHAYERIFSSLYTSNR